MEGIILRHLMKRRGTGYRCLVEAVVTHKVAPEDPLTGTVSKGAKGVAYDFRPYSGNWRQLAIAVDWEPYRGCVYIETYRSLFEIVKPITEIRFVRFFASGEKQPKINPLYDRNHRRLTPT